MSVLKSIDLIKSYDGKNALQGINLTVEKGDVYGLLGPNGAGKSTFLNIVVNLISKYSGTIFLFDQKKNKENLRQIGFVPQDLAIYEDISAYRNVKFFGGIYKLKGKELEERCEFALNAVGLWEHRKRNPITFSGGMKRRLNIACSIVHNPKFIILDEPTVGIDPQSRTCILDSIKALNKDGATIIYTSHYIEEVEAICNKVAIIDAGRIVEEGLISEVKEKYQKGNSYEFVFQHGIKAEEYFPDAAEYGIFTVNNRAIVTSLRDIALEDEVMEMLGEIDELISVGKYRPNLEDIFLTITGKELRDGSV